MEDIGNLRIALLHHLLVKMRGGERVLQAIAELFPGAPVYTLLNRADALPVELRDRPITTTWFQRIPLAHRLYKPLLPLVPLAFESLDFSGYDILISSDSMLAKSVVTESRTFHLCYCHSPPRYLWDLAAEYRKNETPHLLRPAWHAAAHRLRIQDYVAAQRVDAFIANSTVVARRIRKYYRRNAEVVHPPVDTRFYSPQGARTGDFYLFVGELVPYKKPGLLVEAFRGTDARLRIIGDGPLYNRLKRCAPDNVTVEGHQSAEVIREAYRRCRAFVFAGLEDFGIALVEAQACGAPVVAYGQGGALDSVVPGRTGLLMREQSVEAVREAIVVREAMAFDAGSIRRHALSFGVERFQEQLMSCLKQSYTGWLNGIEAGRIEGLSPAVSP